MSAATNCQPDPALRRGARWLASAAPRLPRCACRAAAPTPPPRPCLPRRSPPAATARPVASAVAPRSPAPPAPAAGTLDGRIQDVKADVIKLNRDLLVLEEELLFPANTQVALFVSMDVGKMFELDSVQIKLDDKVVANYLYTPLEVAGAAPRRRAARLSRQPEDRQARARRLLHRQGPARPRLQARRDRQVRQGHRSRSTSSCGSRTRRASCSPSSTSSSGSERRWSHLPAPRADASRLRRAAARHRRSPAWRPALAGVAVRRERAAPSRRHEIKDRRTTATRCSTSSRTATSRRSRR